MHGRILYGTNGIMERLMLRLLSGKGCEKVLFCKQVNKTYGQTGHRSATLFYTH